MGMSFFREFRNGKREGGVQFATPVDVLLSSIAEKALLDRHYRIYGAGADGRAILLTRSDPPLIVEVESRSFGAGRGTTFIVNAVRRAPVNGWHLHDELDHFWDRPMGS